MSMQLVWISTEPSVIRAASHIQSTCCRFCMSTILALSAGNLALVYMSKHRMLTKEILEECLYDSNDDIRRMAAKRLK